MRSQRSPAKANASSRARSIFCASASRRRLRARKKRVRTVAAGMARIAAVSAQDGARGAKQHPVVAAHQGFESGRLASRSAANELSVWHAPLDDATRGGVPAAIWRQRSDWSGERDSDSYLDREIALCPLSYPRVAFIVSEALPRSNRRGGSLLELPIGQEGDAQQLVSREIRGSDGITTFVVDPVVHARSVVAAREMQARLLATANFRSPVKRQAPAVLRFVHEERGGLPFSG